VVAHPLSDFSPRPIYSPTHLAFWLLAATEPRARNCSGIAEQVDTVGNLRIVLLRWFPHHRQAAKQLCASPSANSTERRAASGER
jgi:hypothetical protein